MSSYIYTQPYEFRIGAYFGVFTNAHFSKEVIPIWDWATEVGTASNRPRISEMAPDFLIRLR